MREYWYLVAAACLGLVAGGAVYVHLTGVRQIAPTLIAAADIPAGAMVDDGVLRIAYLPRQAIHPHSLSRAVQARGRVARMAILAGEQVLDDKLSGGSPAGAAPLEDGERAMFIPLGPDRAYPASFIRAGGRVDLIFVSESRRGGDGMARLLLSGVKVLSVHTERQGAFGRDETIQGVTVALEPPQAEKAAYAAEHGQLHILGEGAPGDRGTGAGVTWDNLFGAAERARAPRSLTATAEPGADEGALADE